MITYLVLNWFSLISLLELAHRGPVWFCCQCVVTFILAPLKYVQMTFLMFLVNFYFFDTIVGKESVKFSGLLQLQWDNSCPWKHL